MFPISPFPKRKFSIFHPPKFLMTFFSQWLKLILNLPLILALLIYSPYFFQISLWFRKMYLLFFTYFVFFVSPSTLIMMDLCITQCTNWTHLRVIKITLVIVLKRLHLDRAYPNSIQVTVSECGVDSVVEPIHQSSSNGGIELRKQTRRRRQGHPPAWGNYAFPPVSDFPYFRKIFRLHGKFSKK